VIYNFNQQFKISSHGETEPKERILNFPLFLFVLRGNPEEKIKFTNNNSVYLVNSVPLCETFSDNSSNKVLEIKCA